MTCAAWPVVAFRAIAVGSLSRPTSSGSRAERAAWVGGVPRLARKSSTSITAAIPDPNGKVPAFNAVPGAGINNWSNGWAQAVLVAGQAYNYCISIGSGVAQGKATVSYKISRGAAQIQSGTIIKASQYKVGPNGIWYFCSGYTVLPSSPGTATLTGTVAYTANGSKKPVSSKLAVPILLQ